MDRGQLQCTRRERDRAVARGYGQWREGPAKRCALPPGPAAHSLDSWGGCHLCHTTPGHSSSDRLYMVREDTEAPSCCMAGACPRAAGTGPVLGLQAQAAVETEWGRGQGARQ